MSQRTSWGIAAGAFLVAAIASLLAGEFVFAALNFTLACAMFVFSHRWQRLLPRR